MPADTGSQVVTILYYTAANSSIINKRFQGIRQTGIYSGGYLSVVDNTHAQISILVCEISDGTYQVRVETTSTVNLLVAVGTPYIVLRWTYTGAVTDYMELLAVATPTTNDVVIGKCTFDGSSHLNGFSYQDTSYPRLTPNTQDLFLNVESTVDTELRVRIRAGRIQTNDCVVDIADQKSDLFVPPSSNSRIDLVYISDVGVITIDSSGTAAASPSAPAYKGKLVLAEVTLTVGDTNIVVSKIKDVRNFLSSTPAPDDTTIEKNSEGKLQVKYPLSTIVSAVASGKITCPSNVFNDMDDMNVSFTVDYSSQPIKFEFNSQIVQNDNSHSYFILDIDGVTVNKVGFGTGDDSSWIIASLLYAATNLSVGLHTAKIQWARSSWAYTPDDTDYKRVLCVTKF